MSTSLDIEVVTIEGIDLESSPPCETAFRHPVTNHIFPCGKPSVHRLTLSCSKCGRKRTLFICAPCYQDLKQGRLRCWYCFTNGKHEPVTTYQESL